MNESMALVTGGGPARRVEIRRSLQAPIERVWEAITDAKEVSLWWNEAEIESREGGRVKVGTFVDGTVKVFQPPYVLEFTWNDNDEKPGLVRFDLVQESESRTTITVTQFGPVAEVIPASAGWHDICDRLVAVVEEGKPESHFAELMEVYKNAGVH